MTDLIALRRRLHAIAEVGAELPQTQAALLRSLDGLPVEIVTNPDSSAIAVVIRGDADGATVLLRADMDALPVPEGTGLDFAATNGNMHACGHDLHMSALVGAVHRLVRRRADFAGSVLAVFQPDEEGGGGAERLIADGVLETTGALPVASYAAHVMSYYPSGLFLGREGSLMAATIDFDLTVHGRGGHAARPHAALDPVSVAALIVQGIQTFVAQRSSPRDPIIATVGAIQAGTVPNVISDQAVVRVSLRATTADRAEAAYAAIATIGHGFAWSFGLTVESELGPVLRPTVSDAAGASLVRDTVTDLFGADKYEQLTLPEMISEDFALFLEQTGGAFFLVGAAIADGSYDELPTNHSPRARFDDTVVPKIADVLTELAIRRLRTDSTNENG